MDEMLKEIREEMGRMFDAIMAQREDSRNERLKKEVIKLAMLLWASVDTAFKRGGGKVRDGEVSKGTDKIYVLGAEGRVVALQMISTVFPNTVWSELSNALFPEHEIQLKGRESKGRIALTFRLALFCMVGTDAEKRIERITKFLDVKGNTVPKEGEPEEVEGKMKRGGWVGTGYTRTSDGVVVKGRKSDRFLFEEAVKAHLLFPKVCYKLGFLTDDMIDTLIEEGPETEDLSRRMLFQVGEWQFPDLHRRNVASRSNVLPRRAGVALGRGGGGGGRESARNTERR